MYLGCSASMISAGSCDKVSKSVFCISLISLFSLYITSMIPLIRDFTDSSIFLSKSRSFPVNRLQRLIQVTLLIQVTHFSSKSRSSSLADAGTGAGCDDEEATSRKADLVAR